MPVWVELRVPEFISDPLLKTLRDEVLQALGFIVNFVDGVIQHLEKKGLDQAVMANDLQRTSLPSA